VEAHLLEIVKTALVLKSKLYWKVLEKNQISSALCREKTPTTLHLERYKYGTANLAGRKPSQCILSREHMESLQVTITTDVKTEQRGAYANAFVFKHILL